MLWDDLQFGSSLGNYNITTFPFSTSFVALGDFHEEHGSKKGGGHKKGHKKGYHEEGEKGKKGHGKKGHHHHDESGKSKK